MPQKEKGREKPKAQVKSGMSKKKKEEVLTHQTELRKDFQRENKPSAKLI